MILYFELCRIGVSVIVNSFDICLRQQIWFSFEIRRNWKTVYRFQKVREFRYPKGEAA